MNDPQMTMFEVIRPMPNFETVYQGQPGTIPIAFPGDLDPDAGKPGYDASLLRGISVPLAARLLLQIPQTIALYTPTAGYSYQVMWRTRNASVAAEDLISGRRNTAPYHLPDDGAGRREYQGSAATERIFMPGSSDVEIFEQAEPSGGTPATLNIRQQRYIPYITAPWIQPLLPSGEAGVWQQGAYQFSSNENCSGPTWSPIWLDVAGDEIIILAYKIDTGSNWDFGGDDQAFSNTYGTNDGGLPNNPNIGLLLSTGTMGG